LGGGFFAQRPFKVIERDVAHHIDRVPVIEARAAQGAVVEAEAEPADQV
jgi:hypothetical protein